VVQDGRTTLSIALHGALAGILGLAAKAVAAQVGSSSTVGQETPPLDAPRPAPARHLTAVPWYGWAMVPALAYREWRQWPSKRWWDPLLDAAFLVLGVLTATWSARPPLPFVMLRRRDRRIALAQLHQPIRAGHAPS
jgi:hypothetical protein